ncbi:hypothetical protein BsWGS_18607 [Bradybaena similaris]
MAAVDYCVPGQRLCKDDGTVECGRGAYVRDGFIYACRVGRLEYSHSSDKNPTKTIHIESEENCDTIPSIGDLVIARVTNVNTRFCKCDITCVGTSPLSDVFRGMIRKEDVRATEKDRVEMYKCYRPGDIIVARVLSLGDSLSYSLTTAENELGVVMATSEAGVLMVPLSWNKMQCPKTLEEEFRKVAKVQPEYLTIVRSMYV